MSKSPVKDFERVGDITKVKLGNKWYDYPMTDQEWESFLQSPHKMSFLRTLTKRR